MASPALGGLGDQQMTGVSTFGQGLVAVGLHRLDGQQDGRVWLSDDGASWRAIDDPSLQGVDDTIISRVVDTPAGLIAVGVTGGPNDTDAAVWMSEDGISWVMTDDPHLGGPGDQGVNSIVVAGDLIVIGGWNRDTNAVWTSGDGLLWSPPVELPNTGPPSSIHDLATLDTAVIAVGLDGADGGVWTSVDSVTWVGIGGPELGGDGIQRIVSVTVSPRVLLAVGSEETYEQIFFLGRGAESRFDAAVWSSPGESDWQRVIDTGLDTLGDHLMFRVIEWNGRYVAVGIGNPDPRQGMSGEFDTGFDFDAAVWLSDDGRHWNRVNAAELGGEDWQDIFDVVALGDLLVAVGGDDRGSP
ncbi:MAG TPA: hypothetical protein VF148_07625 [Acidimicrobiia bacterium]